MSIRRARLAAGVLAVALLAYGCSRLPSQPVTTTPDAPAGSSGASPAGPGAEPIAAGATTTQTVTGLLGGTIHAGRFTVIVPPGAITGTASVTVSQPDLSQLQCDLSISPPSANHFLIPVLLVADGSQMNPKLLAVSCIAWLNPATGRFEPVAGSSVSLLNLTVTAPLHHFSTYRVQGKAGW